MLPIAAALWLSFPLAAAEPAPVRMTERERAIHVLDRLAYGPRPGEVDRVLSEGVDAWVARQLHPEAIPDAAVESKLRSYRSLGLSAVALYNDYPDKKSRMMGLFGSGRKPQEIVQELAAAKVLRAVESERQLQEVMTDFWFNHFNVAAQKNQLKWLVSPYERETIRPRVLGKFRDLLGAVARSPGMLIYLDNFQSTIDARYAPAGAREDIAEMEDKMSAGGKNKGRAKLGLNENYARELMELHTLGVDGGYTQTDVTELARVLTGWSLDRPNKKNRVKDFEFKFKRRMHDPGAKVLLGVPIAWSGVDEGDKALDLLARRPETARFIALKLCRRFVADEPPADLVDRVAERFRASGGDIRETLRALFADPAFSERRYFRSKVKTPLEFTASALRATRAELRDPLKIAKSIGGMGQPLYQCEPPTGWPDRAAPWVSAGALLARMRAAAGLFGRGPDAPASADSAALLGGVDPRSKVQVVAAYVDAFLGGEMSDRTRAAILARLDHPGMSTDKIAALVIGSPEFQRR
jgi:uncharacterized protein (DUF1800 family)